MKRLQTLYRRFSLSESDLLLMLAIGVGLASGVGVWLFRLAIEFFHWLFQEQLLHLLEPLLGPLAIVAVLVGGGLLVRFVMDRFIGEERHPGVAGIIEAVALAGGRMRYRRMPFKALASALSIGAGASVGPEAPSVQVGANIGSMFGQMLHLSEDRVRLLVAAGAASAIAAAFRAPLAGVFFALEGILNRDFNLGSFGVVVLASVVSSATTSAIEVGGPELGRLSYELGGPLELPMFALLGLLLAPVCAFMIRYVVWQHDLWHKHVHGWYRTALAGAMVGIVAIWLPQILGDGREAMNEVLNPLQHEYTFYLLIALGIAKLLMTGVSLSGGFVGGIFAPALFVGIMLGGAFGQLLDLILPANIIGDPQSYAIAGMAGLLAGVVRSPVTAILLVFELTNDYRLILPIMLTTIICMVITERIQPDSLDAVELARKGIRLEHGQEIDVMQSVTVQQAMVRPAPQIHENATLAELRHQLRMQNTRSLAVVDGREHLTGIVTLTDLQHTYETVNPEEILTLTVGDICTRSVITAQPDEVVWTAIRKMGARDVGRLPVTDSGGRLLGMLSRNGVMQAYNNAITQRLEHQHTAEQVRLHVLTGAHVLEMHVRPGSPVAGKQIAEVNWPAESVVASVRRHGKLVVPHGNTRLEPGDMITIVAAPEAEGDLFAHFATPVHEP